MGLNKSQQVVGQESGIAMREGLAVRHDRLGKVTP